jgi:hypothetical protein
VRFCTNAIYIEVMEDIKHVRKAQHAKPDFFLHLCHAGISFLFGVYGPADGGVFDI